MKNFQFKNRGLWVGIALSCTVLLMVPLITGAAPATNPPDANLTPEFSGINIKNGATTNLNINSSGEISNPNGSNPVTVKDANGFILSNGTSEILNIRSNGFTTLADGGFSSTTGAGGQIALSGSSKTTAVNGSVGTGGTATSTGVTGNGGLTSIGVNGTGGTGGKFSYANCTFTNCPTATLGVSDAAAKFGNETGTVNFQIGMDGKLSNPSGNVTVNDTLAVTGSANISGSVSASSVSASSVSASSVSGGSVSAGSVSAGSVSAGSVSASSATISGHLSANSIGGYYEAGWSAAVNIPANSPKDYSKSCSGGDIAIFCSFFIGSENPADDAGWISLQNTWSNGSTCGYHFHNSSDSPFPIQVNTLCFSPNS